MVSLKFVENIVEEKLLSLHTCFLAQVLSVSIEQKTAKIQPLGKTKAYGKDAVSQSPITNVPIANHALYKIDTDAYNTKARIDGEEHAVSVNEEDSERMIAIVRELKAGDIVVCVCGERNITYAKRGMNNTPPAGHHSMSDAIIIGCL